MERDEQHARIVLEDRLRAVAVVDVPVHDENPFRAAPLCVPRGHREWWSRLVSTVAYARFAPARGIAAPEFTPMPLAAVVNAVGASRPAPVLPHAWSVDQRWLLAAIFLLLLVEWTSRRLRGSR
jgi:hypothetical protein